MKIVFMGTSEFALPTLRELIRSEHEILSVVTQPDRHKGRGQELSPPPVKIFAQESDIPVLQPENANTPEFIDTLKRLNPDINIVVAFGQILRRELLDTPKLFCMNLHASILPKYRGAAPINRAIINGEKETGVTTMKMDEGLDTGDILLTRTIPIEEADDSKTLHDKLAEEGGNLVLQTLWHFGEQTLTPVPQDNSRSSYAPKLKKKDGLIPWSQTADEIKNLIRGLKPWPGAYTFYKNKRLRILKSQTIPGDRVDPPGEIVRLSDFGIEVGTGKNRIAITELQPEGKKAMSVKNFLAGHTMNKGDHFETYISPETSKNQKETHA